MRQLILAAGLLLVACHSSPSPSPVPVPSPPSPLAPAPVTAIVHATTVYLLTGTLGQDSLITYLTQNLSAIKAAGFNAVYVPAVWATFDPSPLVVPRVYSDVAFANAQASLAAIRAAGMGAVVGLNYIGVGWGPDFGTVLPQAQECDWAITPPVYAAFEQYVSEFMSRMASDKDILDLMVFTESAEGCGQATQAAAPAVALQLQKTLGSLPSHLDPAVRAGWVLGYHDYSIVNLGWGNGVGPVASPNGFDFMSMVAYNVGTAAEMDDRAARFAALYPDKPLFVGEMGTNGCPPSSEAGQATGDAFLVGYALTRGHGFSLWGWVPGGGMPDAAAQECANSNYGGLAITNPDGSARQAETAVRTLLVGGP